LSNPLIFDPISRLVVEQPALDPTNPAPGSIVETNKDGIINPSLVDYAEKILTTEPLSAGDWVNIYSSNGSRAVRKALAADKSKPAHGYVLKDTPVGSQALVYYEGPNTMIPLGAFTAADLGSPVYLNTTTPGAVQTTAPVAAGQAKQLLGYIITIGTTNVTVISRLVEKPDTLPSPAGMAGKFLYTPDGLSLSWSTLSGLPTGMVANYILSTDGSVANWAPLTSLFPTMTGQAGKALTTNGSTISWSNFPQELPSQVGMAGGYLSTDGSSVSWKALPKELPDQAGKAGKYLVTDGTSLSWGSAPSPFPTLTGNSGKFLSNDGTNVGWASMFGVPNPGGQAGKLLTTDGTNLSWASFQFNGMTNPMSYNGDMIVQSGGVASRLSIGSEGTILTVVGGAPTWAPPPPNTLPAQTGNTGKFLQTDGTHASWTDLSGAKGVLPTTTNQSGKFLCNDGVNAYWTSAMVNPLQASWDILVGGSAGTPSRLPIGGEGSLLAVINGRLSWMDAPTSALPAQTGMNGKVLTSNGSYAVWMDVAAGLKGLPDTTGNSGKILSTDGLSGVWVSASPITSPGDMIVGGVGGVPSRLTPGSAGQMLSIVGGSPNWVDATTASLPSQTGNTGKFLTTNGTIPSWTSVLPDLAGNSGKFLTNNGTTASWSTVSPVPNQQGCNGMFLTTNGTIASWVTLPQELPAQYGNSGKVLSTDGTHPVWVPQSGGGSGVTISSGTMVDNQTTYVVVPSMESIVAHAAGKAARIFYKITRGSSFEIGTIVLYDNGTNVQMVQVIEATIGTPGVTFLGVISSTSVALLYTSASTGIAPSISWFQDSLSLM
jgi:hypothetical protein